jgi:hypothetical protein
MSQIDDHHILKALGRFGDNGATARAVLHSLSNDFGSRIPPVNSISFRLKRMASKGLVSVDKNRSSSIYRLIQ